MDTTDRSTVTTDDILKGRWEKVNMAREMDMRGSATGVQEKARPVDTQQTALTKSVYNRNAKSYDKRMAMMDRIAFGSIRSKLWELVRGQEVLEVGVGTGANMATYPQGIRVTGIDLSDGMLNIARQRAERERVEVLLLEMDVQELDFSDATFDSAVTTCVFCSVPDPVRGLSEMKRVLKPDGRLVMLEHVRPSGLLGLLFDLMNPITKRISGANINRKTVENVRRAGFQIESIESRLFGIVKLIVARKD